MGTKLPVTPLGQPENSSFTTELNNTLDDISDEFDNVLYRDGTQSWLGNQNANSKRLYNLPAPVFTHEPLRLGDLSDVLKGEPGIGRGFETRAELADESIVGADGNSALLAEPGREGIFVFNSTNHSTQVTGDTAQGFYIAPSADPTGASGAWVRKFSGWVDIRWFGAKCDTTKFGVGGTDDTAAVQAAINYVHSLGGGTIFVPGHTRCASQLNVVGKSNVSFVGTGGVIGYNAPPNSQLIYTGAGSAPFINAANSNCFVLRDLGVRYTSGSYTGDLIGLTNTTGGADAAYPVIEGCLIGGMYNAGVFVAGARSCVCLEGAILATVRNSHLSFAIIGIAGRREIAVGNVVYSNAHHIEAVTFDNLTGGALLNAGEGWSVVSCWFEGTNGGTGGMPYAYLDNISAASGAITDGLSFINCWAGDGVNVGFSWFNFGDTSVRGLNISGGFWDTSWTSAPWLKTTSNIAGLNISGVIASGALDLGNRAHGGVKVSGNYFGAGIVNVAGPFVMYDAEITGNSVFGGNAPSYLRIRNPQDWAIGDVNGGVGLGYLGMFSAGSLTFDAPAAAAFEIRAPSGQSRYLAFKAGGTNRALFGTDTSANAENVSLITYDNAGGFVGYAFSVTRSNMDIAFGGNVSLGAGKSIRVNGTQVVSAQGAAVADATDAATAITQLNALLARLRTHGLIAT